MTDVCGIILADGTHMVRRADGTWRPWGHNDDKFAAKHQLLSDTNTTFTRVDFKDPGQLAAVMQMHLELIGIGINAFWKLKASEDDLPTDGSVGSQQLVKTQTALDGLITQFETLTGYRLSHRDGEYHYDYGAIGSSKASMK